MIPLVKFPSPVACSLEDCATTPPTPHNKVHTYQGYDAIATACITLYYHYSSNLARPIASATPQYRGRRILLMSVPNQVN